MQIEGYPQTAILVVLLLGTGLALFRPYAAFLFAVFLLTAGHVARFNQTRLAALGPFLNLADVCTLVALLAFFLDRVAGNKPIRIPQIVPLMLFVLAIGAVQSLWRLGWTYDTLRACRWAAQFPLAYFLGANMVTSKKRVRNLVAVLLAGALVAAIQHIVEVGNIWRTKSINMETYHLMRTIGFWAGCIPSAVLVAAVVRPWPRGVMRRILYVGAGLLLLASLFLNQTRSLWLGTILAVGCVIALFKKRNRIRTVMILCISFLILFFVLGWLGQFFLPGIDVFEIVADRTDTLLHSGIHTGTRMRAFEAETQSWLKGTLVFGRGLSFFQVMKNSDDANRRIAFNHLGYVTYLSQLGAIGLLVYGLLLPLGVLKNGFWLWRNGDVPIERYTGLLGAASILCVSVMFVASSQFLILGYEAPAVLYGAMSVAARRERMAACRSYLPAGEESWPVPSVPGLAGGT